MTKLPTGFMMDLNSVHYIMYQGTYNFGKEAVLEIMCEGATVRLFGTQEQIKESKEMILHNINERVKQCQNALISKSRMHEERKKQREKLCRTLLISLKKIFIL